LFHFPKLSIEHVGTGKGGKKKKMAPILMKFLFWINTIFHVSGDAIKAQAAHVKMINRKKNLSGRLEEKPLPRFIIKYYLHKFRYLPRIVPVRLWSWSNPSLLSDPQFFQ
jgi:hypothetical protein